MNKSLHATLVKICTSGGGPLFHSSYDGVIAMLPTQSIFHLPEQMEVRRRQIQTIQWVQYDSPAKIDNVLYGLQTGMGPGIIVLQEKRCLLLWPGSGNSSLLLSQRREVVVGVDGPGSRKSRRSPSSYPKRQCTSLYPLRATSWTFSSMGNSQVATPWTAVLTPACSGDTTSRHQWWCNPGNCHLQPRIGSISPDKLAYSVLYVPV